MGWDQSCGDGKAARSDAKTINSPQRVMSLCWKCEEGKVCVQLEGGKVKNECSSIENLLRCDNVVQSLDSSSLPNRFLSPHASFWWEGIIKKYWISNPHDIASLCKIVQKGPECKTPNRRDCKSTEWAFKNMKYGSRKQNHQATEETGWGKSNKNKA